MGHNWSFAAWIPSCLMSTHQQKPCQAVNSDSSEPVQDLLICLSNGTLVDFANIQTNRVLIFTVLTGVCEPLLPFCAGSSVVGPSWTFLSRKALRIQNIFRRMKGRKWGWNITEHIHLTPHIRRSSHKITKYQREGILEQETSLRFLRFFFWNSTHLGIWICKSSLSLISMCFVHVHLYQMQWHLDIFKSDYCHMAYSWSFLIRSNTALQCWFF